MVHGHLYLSSVRKQQITNVLIGDVFQEETSDSFVKSEHRLVATVGCKNMVVIETADAVLVADKDRAQDVKNIVEMLKEESRKESLMHRKVYRPWGDYESLDVGHNYQVKRLSVSPGKKLSLQMHNRRTEHWVVVSGKATVTIGDKTFSLSVNESTYIPVKTKHRLANLDEETLEVIEVQSGDYLGEDDIIRFDDDFGRETA